MDMDMVASIAYSIIRVSTPIIFAAMAALISKKAGLTNMAVEGIMLVSALTGVVVSAFSNSLALGFTSGLVAGVLLAFFIAYLSLKLKADMVLTCIAANLMASGLTVVIMFIASGDKGTSSNLKSLVMPEVSIPLIDGIPFIGQIFSNHNIMTYLAFITVYLVYFFIYKTPTGLRIRSVGENPNASESVGIDVEKVQIMSFVISGFIGALGGIYMSMGYVSWFARDMVAGRGFIGLSAMNLGNGSPIGSLIAAVIFGSADVASYSLQALKIPAEFVQMIPYLSTIIGLVVFSIIRERNAKKKRRIE
ncbi:ABC transporter permease [Youngiibacter fragilis]|uniref:ABC transporter permease n=1 Tax=Youngiibacter fragilis 232.1 TaxID=994573 RepID=V7I3C3_9CLOT|nr:ABC transporter permease [Youngiibacter fragilis]ETA80745.1 ABC transporter permease [Youngiibacter fragilis 232.1]